MKKILFNLLLLNLTMFELCAQSNLLAYQPKAYRSQELAMLDARDWEGVAKGNPSRFTAKAAKKAMASTLTVINTNDAGTGSLRQVVLGAVSGDTIRFDAAMDGDTIKLTSGQILIDKNLVIIGNDSTKTIIDGTANSRIFQIPAGVTVSMEGLKLQNGVSDIGGAIRNSGALSLNRCLIFQNIAYSYGGGINNGGILGLENCTILGNRASSGFGEGGGGGVYNGGGGTCNFKNSTITKNYTGSIGGGVFSVSGILNFSDCLISENTSGSSTFYGGGVLAVGTSSFANCKIVGNSSVSRGGGLFLSGNANLVHCIISGNSGGGVWMQNQSGYNYRFTNCTISGNNAGNSGGGLRTGGATILQNTIVSKNTAPTDPEISGSYTGSNNLIATDPQFLQDVPTAPSTAGDLRLLVCSPAINAGTPDTTGLNIGMVDLDGNPRIFGATIDIGAYEFQSPDDPLLVTNTNDDGCGSLRFIVANAVSGDTIRFDAAMDGDTIKLTSGQILIDKNLVIIGNDSTKTIIDGMANERIFQIPAGVTVSMEGLKLQNGVSDIGGAIVNSGTLSVNRCLISRNIAYSYGGGIINGGNLRLENCTISENRALDRTFGGGGLHNDNGTCIIKNCTINRNFSPGAGGGVYSATSKILNFSDCLISENTGGSSSPFGGGGVYAGGNSNYINCKIVGNSSNRDGGGFYISGNANLVHCIISGNNSGRLGGGVMMVSQPRNSYRLTNCTISGNSASSGGGGLSTGGATILKNTIVSKNIAPSGSNILGSFTGSNNLIATDPQFLQDVPTAPSTAGDLRLQACSQAINAGTPDTTGLNLGLVDLDGKPRVYEGRIDIGAFEYQSPKPDPLVVTNTDDDGCGSLRLTITQASSGDTVRFSPAINGDSIKLTTGQILVDKNLTIIGNGKDSTIIDGQGLGRIFEVATNVTLNLDSLRLQNGDVRAKSGSASQGGAIFVNGRLNISNSHFHGNKAVVGGALMGPLSGNADIFIDKSTFTSNMSNTQGGLIGFGSDTLSIKNSTFAGNSSLDDAGVIRSLNAGKVLLISSTFSGNSGSPSSGLGGVMRDNGSSIEVNACTFYGNSAWQGGAFHLETNNFSIQNSILKNSASDVGQDINIPSGSGYSLNDLGNNLVFSTDGGHGITDGNNIDPRLDVLADNGGSTPTHALLCDSPARDAGAGTLADQRGFAVFNSVKDIGAFELQTLYKPLLVTNTNDDGCGSLRFIVANAVSGDTIRFDAAMDGDTIKLTSGQILIDKNLVIIGNDSTKTIIDGMANSRIFEIASGITVNMDGLKLQNGSVTTGTQDGGAILNRGNLSLNSCFITKNKANLYGGGIRNAGTLHLENCLISENSVLNVNLDGGGGGIFSNGISNFRYCTISKNYSEGAGGGVLIHINGTANFTDCLITENTCSASIAFFHQGVGGGVLTRGISNFTNCKILGNSAVGAGGGIAILSRTNLISCIISGNTTRADGGGVYMNGSTYIIDYKIKNCTISGNYAKVRAGGLSFFHSADLENTIISKNSSPTNPNIYGTGTMRGNNNLIGTDPLFVMDVPTAPSTGGDLRLQACSPAINAGSADTTGLNLGAVDIAGNPRISGGRIDIGAYERAFTLLEITERTSAEFNELFACENSSIKLPAGLSSPDFTYQWQIDQGGGFSDLSEASPYSQTNGDTLLISPIVLGMDGYRYRTLIADGCGGNIISDTITLRVGELPVLVSSPLTQEVCPGNEVVIEAEFSGAGFSFLWQVDEGSGFVNVSGSDYTFIGNKLLISNFDYAKNNNQYRALAKSNCFEVPSDAATITINTDVTILAQPTSQTVCEFSTAIFTAQAVKLSAGTLTYQWQRKSGTGIWTNINTGGRYTVNGNQLSIANAPASWNGAEFRCLMNDYCQTIPKTLNVIPVAHVTQNPVNQEICVGNNAGFSVSAAGQGLTYRWQVNSGSGFVNLTDGGIYQGVTSANLSLSFPTSVVNGYQYRCLVSGTSTCDLVADTSAVASISVGIAAEAQTVFYNSPISTNDGVTQAVGYILGINDILAPSGKAEFRAGNAILLNPGFEVQAGAVFTAKIQNPCQTVSTSFEGGSNVPKEKVK